MSSIAQAPYMLRLAGTQLTHRSAAAAEQPAYLKRLLLLAACRSLSRPRKRLICRMTAAVQKLKEKITVHTAPPPYSVTRAPPRLAGAKHLGPEAGLAFSGGIRLNFYRQDDLAVTSYSESRSLALY